MKRIAAVLALAAVLAGCGRLASAQPSSGLSAGPTPGISAPKTSPAAETAAAPTKGLPGRQTMLDAFKAIAFTSEYPGSQDETPEIRKWAAPIRLAIHGSATDEDIRALNNAMKGLNALAGFPGIAVSKTAPNADIRFVKLEQMGKAVPGYVEGNWGFFTVQFDNFGGITKATIAIATDVTDQEARTHLIHEELLQATGLMQDEYTDPESIFYGKWTTTPEPTEMDWELLRMLYLPEVKPGMAESDAMAALEKAYETE